MQHFALDRFPVHVQCKCPVVLPGLKKSIDLGTCNSLMFGVETAHKVKSLDGFSNKMTTNDTYWLRCRESLWISPSSILRRSLHSVPCLPSGTNGNGGSRNSSNSLSDKVRPVEQAITTRSSPFRFLSWKSNGSLGLFVTAWRMDENQSQGYPNNTALHHWPPNEKRKFKKRRPWLPK